MGLGLTLLYPRIIMKATKPATTVTATNRYHNHSIIDSAIHCLRSSNHDENSKEPERGLDTVPAQL